MTTPVFSNPSDDRTPGGIFTLGGDLSVHRLGFGAMRITGEGVWGPPKDHAEALRVLRRAVELGVNFIDTADSYGPHHSENLIAEALYPYPSGLVIATKGGLTRTGPNQWPPDGRPEYLKEVCEGSLKRLKLDRIDLYQFHRPDPKVPFEDSVGAIAELQQAGKIRHVGLSNVTVEQLAAAQKILTVVSVQNRYNLKDRSSEAVLRACEVQGHRVFAVQAAVARRRPGRRRHWHEVAGVRGGITAGQVSLAYLLARSPVMLPIPGTGSVAHSGRKHGRGRIDPVAGGNVCHRRSGGIRILSFFVTRSAARKR